MGQEETFYLMTVFVGSAMGCFLLALLRISPRIRNKVRRFLFAFICTPALFFLALLINFIPRSQILCDRHGVAVVH